MLHFGNEDSGASGGRVFKTALFARAARKALLTDVELCAAIAQVMLGHADDLGGGVFKKRLGKNLYRSIVLARGDKYWVYEFLLAKKDQANIKDYQLAQLRVLAKEYATLNVHQVSQLLLDERWMEICHEDQTHL